MRSAAHPPAVLDKHCVAGDVGPSSRAGSVHARAAAAGADNQIGDVGATALAEGVKASGTLTILYLSGECGRGRGTELARGQCSCARCGGGCSQPDRRCRCRGARGGREGEQGAHDTEPGG